MWLLLPLFTLAHAAGIGLGLSGLAGPAPPALCVVFAWFPVAASITLVRRPPAAAFAVVAGAFFVGLLAGADVASTPVPPPPFVGDIEVVVDVIEGARPALPSHSFEGRALAWRGTGQRDSDQRWRPCSVRGRFRVDGARWLPAAGDRLRLRGAARPPRARRHRFAPSPAHSARLGGRAFDFRVESEPILLGVTRSARRGLDRARMRHERAVFTTVRRREAAVIVAITTGSRGAIDPDDRERFRRNGAAHVLAVSGLHLGLLGLGFLRLARWLLRRIRVVTETVGADRAAAALTLPAIAAYVILTGAPASAVRAGMMASVVLVGLVVGRPGAAGHALCAAVTVMLLGKPLWLVDFGFQLSVTATAGLIAMSAVDRASPRSANGSWAQRLLTSLRASTVASLATAPILLWHTGVFPVLGPVTNLVVVPPIALVALPAGALGGVLAAAEVPGGGAVLTIAELATRLALAAARLGQPVLSVGLVAGRPEPVALAGWFVVALFAPWLARCSPRRHAVAILTATALLSAAPPRSLAPPTHMEVHAIPVGQGDCALIALPDGTTVLVDGGGSAQSSTAIARDVRAYLNGLGIARVDGFVATHGDIDHVGGLVVLAPLLRPRQAWIPDRADPGLQRVALAVEEAGGSAFRVGPTGRAMRLGSTRIELHGAGGGSDNDGGLVLRACHREVCALFPGDIEEGREAELVAAGTTLRAALLSVPHHGSRTSSTDAFLAAVAPRVAVVQAGAGNRFGFPHPEPLGRLRARAVRVLGTDRGRAVVFATDGEGCWKEP